jgi:hypothetical protein
MIKAGQLLSSCGSSSGPEIEIKEIEIQVDGGISSGLLRMRLAVEMSRQEGKRRGREMIFSVRDKIKRMGIGEPIEVI